MEINELKINRRIQAWMYFFIIGLLVSGITAIPLQFEIDQLQRVTSQIPFIEVNFPLFTEWIARVQTGITQALATYPFLQYGTDWLAFAHIVIAVAFIGVLRDPVRNVWVIEFGMIACVLVIPAALGFGALRQIPIFWRVIDCLFGIVGFIPLWIVRRDIKKLEALEISLP